MKIVVSGLKKSFGASLVLKDINLTIESGCFATILGASGCGKTTLLRILSGLETADQGAIHFDARCVYSSAEGILVPPEKRKLGFVFQDFALWPHMTVFENVAFGPRVQKRQDLKAAVQDALAAVRLAGFEKRYPHELSGGQQQRVSFARAIAVDPECILFDEPLSALDAVLREEMRQELRELINNRKCTALFVTHDQTEAMTMSDRVILMEAGCIIQTGTPEQVYTQPETPFAGSFLGRSNWISETAMIRPEKVSLTPTEGAQRISVAVTGAAFLGDSYLVSLAKGESRWFLYSPARIQPGSLLDVYIHPKDIIHCLKEQKS